MVKSKRADENPEEVTSHWELMVRNVVQYDQGWPLQGTAPGTLRWAELWTL